VKYCRARRRPRRERASEEERKAERKDETGWAQKAEGEEERGAPPINPSSWREEFRHRKMSLSGDLARGSSYKSSRITGFGEMRDRRGPENSEGREREREKESARGEAKKAEGVATAVRGSAREFPFNAAARYSPLNYCICYRAASRCIRALGRYRRDH